MQVFVFAAVAKRPLGFSDGAPNCANIDLFDCEVANSFDSNVHNLHFVNYLD